mmetsp:Transcript_13452/g.47429  ORF Transcript_13452/g.47429 Transcript_13452/m.47429 type:complete len:275 (+) Transcript_13452:2018-2842(+)
MNDVFRGHVALSRPVVRLADRAKVPVGRSVRAACRHGLAVVHEPDGPSSEQHILDGDVAVRDAVAVQVANSLHQLPGPSDEAAALDAATAGLHLAEQVPTLCVLQHQPNVAALMEDRVHLQQVLRLVRLRCEEAIDGDLTQAILGVPTRGPAVQRELRGLLAERGGNARGEHPLHHDEGVLPLLSAPLLPPRVHLDPAVAATALREALDLAEVPGLDGRIEGRVPVEVVEVRPPRVARHCRFGLRLRDSPRTLCGRRPLAHHRAGADGAAVAAA